MKLGKTVGVFIDVEIFFVEKLVFEFPSAIRLINDVEINGRDFILQHVVGCNQDLVALEDCSASVLQRHRRIEIPGRDIFRPEYESETTGASIEVFLMRYGAVATGIQCLRSTGNVGAGIDQEYFDAINFSSTTQAS